ncbi:MAG: hypothetical protein PHF31_10460 [Methylobacter sp.]|nr:hypothetical protein [Methylobacter sp.]
MLIITATIAEHFGSILSDSYQRGRCGNDCMGIGVSAITEERTEPLAFLD